ncbi:GNAT family N-acetyltransferase [Pseudonocardia sp. DSM 110487]|uniref:GNAT family N-acetyltransferase n=1 Tax=Pseudonocardia sp. DSM 110487 TaxID=2865833 RepID=UPI001C6A5784|nr:GNAT family N-acetyltransferase [Pseudonocardia sp. DSM 110487]QYN39590.1 GNAT family N-acetyltransferase [Pseudonocardia sp. DSM 110487]
MSVNDRGKDELDVRELRAETWDDFERVLGRNGGARGCWCMHWRLSIAEWMEGKGEGNKQAMKELASREQPPGVLVYEGDEPVAWCALGPRGAFPRLERSPILASVDDEPVCAITCIFVHRQRRGAGLLPAVLDAVCDYAATRGYPVAEGYPVEPRSGRRAGSDTAMTGIASAFLGAGFTEVARRKADRPVMRRSLG